MDKVSLVLDAFVRHDLAAAAACFAEDGHYRERSREPIIGPEAIARHFSQFSENGASWRFVVDEVLRAGTGACVVYRFAVEGQGGTTRERAGIALVRLNERGEISLWREYEG